MNAVDIYDGLRRETVVHYSCGHRAWLSAREIAALDVMVGRDTLASAKKLSTCPICLYEALWKAHGSRLDV